MSKEDFSQYGKDFQETLCHLILVDRPFADQMFEVLNINFLELKYLQTFVQLVKNIPRKVFCPSDRKNHDLYFEDGDI